MANRAGVFAVFALCLTANAGPAAGLGRGQVAGRWQVPDKAATSAIQPTSPKRPQPHTETYIIRPYRPLMIKHPAYMARYMSRSPPQTQDDPAVSPTPSKLLVFLPTVWSTCWDGGMRGCMPANACGPNIFRYQVRLCMVRVTR